jgi:hypothetical protein
VKSSGAPSIGDIVEIAHAKPRTGLVVRENGRSVGIIYFKPSTIPGIATDFVWWIDRKHVRVISAS